MRTERTITPMTGYIALVIFLILGGAAFGSIVMVKAGYPIFFAVAALTGLTAMLILPGFFVNNPNESKALTLFGKYKGTVKANGFFWANPFFKKKHISLRARNLDGQTLKVNDLLGNPIEIGAVVVWKVKDTFKAAFDVDNYTQYVHTQSEAAVRVLAGVYPYDNFDAEEMEVTLRNGGEQVNEELEKALTDRLSFAGIEVIEARISHLAYAQEIASAMLQRQQATAVVAARQKIVEGAVGMVEMALDSLKDADVVKLDEESKASMVSNLLVVLCSDKSVSPIVNTSAA